MEYLVTFGVIGSSIVIYLALGITIVKMQCRGDD